MVESRRISGFGHSVFAEISRLALERGAVNLGQGFPDFDGPTQVLDAAIDALRSGHNQYAVSQGAPVLRAAIAAHARRFYGQSLDPLKEVGVTSGATEAIFAAFQALTEPGDEVVLFEPFYDSYLACAQMAHVTPRFVRLRPPDAAHRAWWFEDAELRAAITSRTKLVVLNTPNNPTGKCFTREELSRLGELLVGTDAVLLSDEVYEHLVFDGHRHLRPASIASLADRTLTVSSSGKTFSFTGWKVGWHVGPERLVTAVQKAHQWITFCSAAPFQPAIATALGLPDSFFAQFVERYTQRRAFLAQALSGAGFEVLPCEGTYFLMARTDRHRQRGEDDVALCRRLLLDHGLAAIPPSVFYSPEHASEAHGLARFAFCKTDAVLARAAERLASLR